MTGAELKTFVVDGLGAGDIGDTEFYILLNVAKTKLEEERNWKVLEVQNSNQTAVSGDTFLSTKDLPSDFAEDINLFLSDSSNHALPYHPLPFRERYERKDEANGYWIDLVNSKFGLTGIAPAGYSTINLIYRKTSAEINESSSWTFPSRFHPLLGFMVAEMFKLGVDYDSVSARQAMGNRADALALYNALFDWDTGLRNREQGNMFEGTGGYSSDGLPTGGNKEFPLSLMG